MRQTWIPDEPVPCAADPHAWTEEAQETTGRPGLGKLTSLRMRTALAREICKTSCPLRVQCLESALTEEKSRPAKQRYGIRGGLLPQERETLARRRREGIAA